MKNFLAILGIAVLITIFSLPNKVFAGANLEVLFETGAPPVAMFNESNFLPGDTVTKWAKITNKTTSNQSIVAKLSNYSNPDGLGEYFDVIIKENGSLTNIFSGTMAEFAALSELVLNNSLAPNLQKQYDFSVTFRPEAGNPYQEKVLSFDFLIGLQGGDVGGCEGADCDGGGGGGSSGGGGGGGGSSSFASISGTKFNDINRNGVRDVGEGGLSGWQIYLDLNGNGLHDVGEPITTTDGNGDYVFTNLVPAPYVIREIQQSGWTQTYPNTLGNSHALTLSSGQLASDLSFGNTQGEVSGTNINNTPLSLPQILGAMTELPRTGAGLANVGLLISLVFGFAIFKKAKK